ncbi:MAG: septum formation inhibitor Maf [Balneolaceae bacterium]|nr:septum formation inhibitor Maf [Balneolaceae bacterium]
MQRIILASGSPRRKKLLEQLGMAFKVCPSNAEEVTAHTQPATIVEDLALLKANDVAHSFSDSIVIGADTIVVFNDEILGKPESEEQAIEMLARLSGKTHDVYTGVAFVKTDKKGVISSQKTFHEQTKVQFSTLSSTDILSYVQSRSPMDKAGAYGIQDDWGAVFVERIEGDYYNVVGLPLNRFYRELQKFHPHLSFKAT